MVSSHLLFPMHRPLMHDSQRILTMLSCSHIPYRNSSLTKLLRNSLGGNAKTSVICTATPVAAQAKITKNTLV